MQIILKDQFLMYIYKTSLVLLGCYGMVRDIVSSMTAFMAVINSSLSLMFTDSDTCRLHVDAETAPTLS